MSVQLTINTTLETFNDWALKAHAIRVTLNEYINKAVEYTTNPPVLEDDGLVDVPIDITPEETYKLALAAHIKGITLNDFIVNDVLVPTIQRLKEQEV